MIETITGLHHVTVLSRDPNGTNGFLTNTLGLRRIKKTVNADAPDNYQLYYGDGLGTPGSVLAVSAFENLPRGRIGTGEVGTIVFSVSPGALSRWRDHLTMAGVPLLGKIELFGTNRLLFEGSEGETFALQVTHDAREPHAWSAMDAEYAIRGLHSVSMRVLDEGPISEVLQLLGYERAEQHGNVTRFVLPQNQRNGAHMLDVESLPDGTSARQGAGSVHRLAFSVPDMNALASARAALVEADCEPTSVIDRSYFHSIFFRGPEGLLFEIATEGPGFAADGDHSLGDTLVLPSDHEARRTEIERALPVLD